MSISRQGGREYNGIWGEWQLILVRGIYFGSFLPSSKSFSKITFTFNHTALPSVSFDSNKVLCYINRRKYKTKCFLKNNNDANKGSHDLFILSLDKLKCPNNPVNGYRSKDIRITYKYYR